MISLERELAGAGYTLVCGIDEAGCGPLAGPVCAAAVILPPEFDLPGLDDSKKLSEKKREFLFPMIQDQALAWTVAWASAEEIDRYNILQARLLAMRRAAVGLGQFPDYALIDGNRDPHIPDIPAQTIVGGDGKCACIAAASVLAKVSRDRFMVELDREYPQYGFARHKGYPTALHRAALLEYGPCPQHRRSFLKKLLGETP